MPEPHFSSTRYPSALLQALFGPQPTAPASTTQTQIPSEFSFQPPPTAYKQSQNEPMSKTAAKLDSLLQAIKNVDALSPTPIWQLNWKRIRAQEVAQVLRDLGGYNGLKWKITSGLANPYLKYKLQLTHPEYRNMFSKGGQFGSLEFPETGISVDIPHFNAALSRYLDCYSDDCALPTEWASWAGDMFTYAAHLDSIQRNNSLSYTTIRDSALSHIGGIHPQYSKFFGTGDFYADIDARNIASLISNRGLSFYEAMNRYYKQGDFDRFGTFIHSYGGWKKFVEKVNKHYFFPLTLKINPYILEISKQAFINKVLREFLHEMEMD